MEPFSTSVFKGYRIPPEKWPRPPPQSFKEAIKDQLCPVVGQKPVSILLSSVPLI